MRSATRCQLGAATTAEVAKRNRIRPASVVASFVTLVSMATGVAAWAATAPMDLPQEDIRIASSLAGSDPSHGHPGWELLFDSGMPLPNPYGICGSCYGWSSTYYRSETDFDLTARRFVVPSGSFATAFRAWWAYGEEGPFPNSANQGGEAADFSSITLDLYLADGPGGAPGTLLTNLTGTWSVLDVPSHYKEFVLDEPYVFPGTDFFAALRAETDEPSYQATILWLMCAPNDPWIDYESYDTVNGDTGGWSPYTVLSPCPADQDFGLQVVGSRAVDGVTVTPEPPCITPATPCNQVVFGFDRADTTPVRGFSVTFQLTNLKLCVDEHTSIEEGPYLSGHCGGGGCTAFEVIDNGGGSYTVDCAILGAGCGPDSSGTLFTVDLAGDGVDGLGTIEVTSVLARDCTNGPISANAGAIASIDIDSDAPTAVADLTAAALTSGNDEDGTLAVALTFTTPSGASTVEVYRAPYVDGTLANAYPEYDDLAGSSQPSSPTYPPGPPWALTAVTASGQSDETSQRGFWYYAVFTKDDCENVSAVSNLTPGVLNYYLGDVSDGVGGQGDNYVDIIDITDLGSNYGATIGIGHPKNYLDVGPTVDFSTTGFPTTDDEIDFEDLILFAINYGSDPLTDHQREVVGAGSRMLRTEEFAAPALRIRPAAPATPGMAQFELILDSNHGRVQGAHVVLQVASPARRIERGALLGEQRTEVFFETLPSEGTLVVDLAGLGAPLVGDGVLAAIELPAGVVPILKEASVRDGRNRDLLVQTKHGPRPTGDQRALVPRSSPTVDGLVVLGARPNPFSGETTLSFRIANAGVALLRIIDVSGRAVVERALAVRAGENTFVWNGRSSSGERVAAGVYMYELRASDSVARGKFSFTR